MTGCAFPRVHPRALQVKLAASTGARRLDERQTEAYGLLGVQIGGSEEDAIAGGDVDEVEVDPCLRDPAGKVGEDAGVILEHGETVLSPE